MIAASAVLALDDPCISGSRCWYGSTIHLDFRCELLYVSAVTGRHTLVRGWKRAALLIFRTKLAALH